MDHRIREDRFLFNVSSSGTDHSVNDTVLHTQSQLRLTNSDSAKVIPSSNVTKPKRRNPLFIGTVEEDLPVEDVYFNHGGNLTSFMHTYVQLHDELISSQSNRCVIYMPMKETGLGNSLQALSASFIYAALTKRAFCLNYNAFTKHFTFDFKQHNTSYSFTTVPPEYSIWNRHYNIMQPTDKSMILHSPRWYSRRPGVIATGFHSYLHLVIRHDNYIEKLKRMGFLDPALIRRDISDETPSEECEKYYALLAKHVIHTFLRRVLKPQPWVKEIVDDIIRPIQDKFLLGLHIRFGSSGGTFRDSHVFLEPTEWKKFAIASEMILKEKKLTFNQTKWILSTDSDNAEGEFRKLYKELIITNKTYKRGHSKTGAKNPEGFTRAVIDISLLARCQFLITTSYSTFSEIAEMMSANMSEVKRMKSHGFWYLVY